MLCIMLSYMYKSANKKGPGFEPQPPVSTLQKSILKYLLLMWPLHILLYT